ncbi:exosporium glycoprotein BclB-related protein [Peribacillus sp. NPDC056705]|uniref:exosporium glycoprotein BclB-related protein n=1 Tax=Peribacillus sp. NPDC056705 TaxID=3345918 RepID=UPI00374A3CC4
MTSVQLGLANTGGLIGFGRSTDTVTIGERTITISPGLEGVLGFAFVAPRAGTVSSISAFFSATAAVTLNSAVTIRAELWKAAAASNTFTPTGAFVLLTPALGPGISIGDTAHNTALTGLGITAGDKLLLVFSIDNAVSVLTTVAGFASAGITII